MPISALAAWPHGWMQNLNFFVAGALSAAFTIGVHRAISPTRRGVVGIVLLLASSVGFVLDGLFPWINVNGVPTEPLPHALAAVLTFLCASTGLIVLSRRMTADARWYGLSAYVLSTGIVMLILFVVVGFFAVDAGTPFHRWAGLLQRVLAAVWILCGFVMASRCSNGANEHLWAGRMSAAVWAPPNPRLQPTARLSSSERSRNECAAVETRALGLDSKHLARLNSRNDG
jgi:hypothetical membrane protein